MGKENGQSPEEEITFLQWHDSAYISTRHGKANTQKEMADVNGTLFVFFRKERERT